MLNQVKQVAMSQAMKLMSHPKFTKIISDPRVMNAIAKGFELQGQVRSQVENGLRSLADSLNLATKDELSKLRRKLGQVQDSLGALRSKLDSPKPAGDQGLEN